MLIRFGLGVLLPAPALHHLSLGGNKMRKVLLAAVSALAVAACSSNPTPAPAATPLQKALIGEHGFDTTGVDRSVAACDDFYRFAVGKWRDAHPLPAMYSRYGRFEELADRNRDVLRQVLEE